MSRRTPPTLAVVLSIAIAGCSGELSSSSDPDAAPRWDVWPSDGAPARDDGADPTVAPSAEGGGPPPTLDGAPPAVDGAPPPADGPAPTTDSGVQDYPLPPIPAGCSLKARIVTYNPNGWSRLLDAFEQHPTPCADYLIFLPAITSDKTKPRAGAPVAAVRARKGRFHAVAELHFGAWSKVSSMSWYDRGVEFRKRMEAAGYNISRGDTWAINELPSSVRTDPTTQSNVRQLVKGLYTGPPGASARAGIVFVVGMGQGTLNHTVYKPALKSWLSSAAFWSDMDKHVLHWGQEAYVSADRSCVSGSTVGARATRVNDFALHPAILAGAGPAAAAAARTFFDAAYVPVMTAVWNSPLYGGTQISLDAMKRMVSLETYAARAWASSHPYPDGRIGFAWDNNAAGASAAQLDELAARLAQSIQGAYGVTGTAAHACSPSGAYTWCGCSVSAAQFNDAWKTYATW